MSDLYQRSIEIILEHQDPGGAYLASPNFPNYRYSWFRDGAFISYSMGRVGEYQSSEKFHRWAASTILNRAEIIERAVTKARLGEPLTVEDYLHTRYAVHGGEASEDWPNFQLDGFGTWLWALGEHQRLSKKPLTSQLLKAAQLVAAYIGGLWNRPCFDCWEEFPDQVHPYTLAAIYAGLGAHAHISNTDHQPLLADIRSFLQDKAIHNGHYVKFIGSKAVDASLLGLAVPYQVFDPADPVIQTTVAEIENRLRNRGGVHRYAQDTYYGGGEWLLLTAWLGWYYVLVNEMPRAVSLKRWIEAQADANGFLAEQIPATLIDPNHYEPWRQRWGEIANPLLWSHAMYIILADAISA